MSVLFNFEKFKRDFLADVCFLFLPLPHERFSKNPLTDSLIRYKQMHFQNKGGV